MAIITYELDYSKFGSSFRNLLGLGEIPQASMGVDEAAVGEFLQRSGVSDISAIHLHTNYDAASNRLIVQIAQTRDLDRWAAIVREVEPVLRPLCK